MASTRRPLVNEKADMRLVKALKEMMTKVRLLRHVGHRYGVRQ